MSTLSATNIRNSGSSTNNLVLNADGSVTFGNGGTLTLGAAQASTSGTAIDFVGIPSWAKRITVGYYNVSTNNASSFLMLQVGSGSFLTTGYTSQAAAGSGSGVQTNGLHLASQVGSSSYVLTGIAQLMQLGNLWIYTAVTNFTNTTSNGWQASGNTPATSIDRIRFTTSTGATFTNGSINIMYEG